MKHFVLLHNLIMMAQANILNSVEQWFPVDVEEVKLQLHLMVDSYYRNKALTVYQHQKLINLIEGIEANPDK